MSTHVDRFKVQDAYHYARFAAGLHGAFEGERNLTKSAALRMANRLVKESMLDVAVRPTSIKWAAMLSQMIKNVAAECGIDAETGEGLKPEDQ